MTIQLPELAGKWWRSSRYEIRAGYIRPADGARLESVDPWRSYGAAREKRLRGETPYQSLMALTQALPELHPGDELPADSANELAAWCSKHGLLGVLPHRAELVYLAPRDDGDQRGYLRGGGGWTNIPVSEPDEVSISEVHRLPGDEFGSGREVLVPTTAILRPAAAAFVRPLDGGPPVRENLGATWARYFRNVPSEQFEDFRYPIPLSDAFWSLYQEPVADFIAAARALVDAVELVGKKPVEMTAAFDFLLSTVRPVIVEVRRHRGPGVSQQSWRAHSLLGSLAMMAVQDLSVGRRGRVRKCGECHATYVSFALKGATPKWCSRRCRVRVAVRKSRAT